MGLNEAQKKERSIYLEKNLEITECSQRKPYVFISYASDNWETVFKTAVVPMQRQYGLRVYADKAFDKVNDKWIVPMLRNIRGADVIVAFVSQSYIESYACFLELLTAVNNRKPIVFVSLEEQLYLGATTDQPVVERGAKNEILNQGANISTNTNNTSNDIMRAMKSAYTSISTLLEQDALSKYDISDAFINFFRDASINRKTINDLGAVRGTIRSVSGSVFDRSLIVEPEHKVEPVKPAEQPPQKPERRYEAQPVKAPEAETPAPAEPIQPPEPVQVPPAEPVQQPEPAQAPPAEPVWQPEPKPAPEPSVRRNEGPAAFSFSEQEKAERSAKPKKFGLKGRQPDTRAAGYDEPKKPRSKLKIILLAALGVLVFFFLIGACSSNNVTDRAYTLSDGSTGLYTGPWEDNQPSGTGTGTFVYDGDGSVYEGEWLNGQIEGTGTIKWSDGNSYEGEWKNNMFHGRGVYTYPNGATYDGEFKDNYFNGQGTMTWPDGRVYTGAWSNDLQNGEGTMTYADGTTKSGNWVDGYLIETLTYDNGDVYTGVVEDGAPNGHGRMEFADGSVYEGEWKNGYFSGQGDYKAADGFTYTGEWLDGTRSGQGSATYSNGDAGEGEWADNYLIDGTYTWANGNVYVGPWALAANGTYYPNGKGRETYTNGDVYEGQWVDGYYHGQGTLTTADGFTYTGQWVKGMRSGQGSAKYSNGDAGEGEWADNFLINGTYTWADGSVYVGPWAPASNGTYYPNGTGRETYANGDVYEGQWVDGHYHGQGTLTKADGTTYSGVWNMGTLTT